MLDSTRIRRGFAALIALAAIAVLTPAGTAPAAAYSDPAQLIITPGNPAAEDLGGLAFSGECLAGSDAATLRWDTGSGQVTLPLTLDGSGAFSDPGPYFTGAEPGLGLAVTLDCLAAGASLGAAYEFAMYPDLGSTVDGGTAVAADAAFAPSYDCGTAVAPSGFTSAWVIVYGPGDVELDRITDLAVPAGSAAGFGTPASYGLAVGDEVSVYLDCFANDGASTFVASVRNSTFTVAAASAAAAPAVDADAELAATGVDARPLTALAVVMAGLGVVLVVRRRRAA